MHRLPLGAAFLVCGVLNAQAPRGSLVNPLLDSGPDPWVYRAGVYYFMHTSGTGLAIRSTRNLAELDHAARKEVWRASATGPCSRDVWAPELHFLRGKWYIYFAVGGARGNSSFGGEHCARDE